MTSVKCDVAILGAGVVGLSTGIALLKASPKLRVAIIEKESTLGRHASGRNSGVLHAGFYYSPESLKAKFCREGNFELRELCSRHGIEIKTCGKVVVARNQEEEARLEVLYSRGIKNGVKLELLEESEDRKSTRLNSSHVSESRMPSSA